MRLPICRTADYPTNVNARTMDLQYKRDATLPQPQATWRDAAASSKVRIYRSHGEYLRELHGTTRKHAKGDGNPQQAGTAEMANANAHALRNCTVVYRNSPR